MHHRKVFGNISKIGEKCKKPVGNRKTSFFMQNEITNSEGWGGGAVELNCPFPISNSWEGGGGRLDKG